MKTPRGAATPKQRLTQVRKGEAVEASPKPASPKPTKAPPRVARRPIAAKAKRVSAVITLTPVAARETIASTFVVVDRHEVPRVVGTDVSTRFHVRLEAVYEPLSRHHGLVTEQGNDANRIFGAGVPEARIDLVFESRAVADLFAPSVGFAVTFAALASA